MNPSLWLGATVALMSLVLAACTAQQPTPSPKYETIGQTTEYAPAFRRLVPAETKIEKLTPDTFTWSEGPTWIVGGGYLLFTDVPQNTMYRWSEQDGLSVFMKPSGYDGPDLGVLREAGANGLYAEPQGTVLLANSGSRIVERLDPATKQKTAVASTFGGLRFNSPNDVIRSSDGTIFFTDPPYGLKDGNESPAKELRHNGVYRIDTDGRVALIDAELTYPNGIALSPDERTLYVANSDPARPIWMAYTLNDRGEVTSKRQFADASDILGDDSPGLPDGLAVAQDGTLFATGPGGVLVLSPQGERLGRIETGTAIANCAFGDDGRTLYMTSHHFLARARLNAAGVGFPRYQN